MKTFEIDYGYKLSEFEAMTVDASDSEEAEAIAIKQIKDITPDDATDIEIHAVRELKLNG